MVIFTSPNNYVVHLLLTGRFPLSRALLDIFCSRSTNPNGAQLIATVDDPMLRRDQVWLSEKENGATRTYSLTDIRTRKGDNLERGYLQHRFGATPRRLRGASSTLMQPS